MKHDKSGLCLRHLVAQQHHSVIMTKCDEGDPYQKWVLEHYNPANNERAVP